MSSFNTYSSKTNKFTTKTFSTETARVNGETGPVFLLSDEQNIFLVNITDEFFPVGVTAEQNNNNDNKKKKKKKIYFNIMNVKKASSSSI